MSSLISPLLWQSIPFRGPNKSVPPGQEFVPYGVLEAPDFGDDAFADFQGQHQQWHIELAKLTNTRFVLMDDLKDNLQPHGTMHRDVALALGVSPVTDLESFDLRDETSWVSWHFLNSQDHSRFQLVTGL